MDLNEEEYAIWKDRNIVYGDSTVANTQLGLIWTAMIQQHYGIELPHPIPADLALLLQAGMKLCRLARKPDHEDSQKDALVYMKLASKATRQLKGEE